MKHFFQQLGRFLLPLQPVPKELQSNFTHLYFDIGWYGILTGTSLAFLSVYAARIGASGFQMGLISAGPAIVNLIFTLPAGLLLGRHRLDKSIFWSSVLNRIFYSAWIFLPLFVPAKASLWIIIGTTLMMNIPGSVLAVGFTVFFGEAVPIEWRGMVAGIRNAVIGLVTMVTTLIAGQILVHLPIETGYAIVFGLGFLGSAMSSVHLYFVKPIKPSVEIKQDEIPTTPIRPQSRLNLDIVKGVYGRVMGLLFFFHFFQFLAIPIFPLFTVNILKYNDQTISIGSTLFYLTQFLVSLNLDRLVRKRNNLQVMGLGMVMLGAYPLLMAAAGAPWTYYIISLVGGTAWGLAGGVMVNYLLERMSPNDKPGHMVWYNLVLNFAVLIGSLLGPLVAGWVGFVPALIICGLGRSLAGAAVLKWG